MHLFKLVPVISHSPMTSYEVKDMNSKDLEAATHLVF